MNIIKRAVNVLFLLPVLILMACGESTLPAEQKKEPVKPEKTDSVYLQVKYFQKLRAYIHKNGREEKVNASSMAGRPKYIYYHIIALGEVEAAVDHSERIYFTHKDTADLHIGNVMMKGDKVLVEDGVFTNRDLVYKTYVQMVEKYAAK